MLLQVCLVNELLVSGTDCDILRDGIIVSCPCEQWLQDPLGYPRGGGDLPLKPALALFLHRYPLTMLALTACLSTLPRYKIMSLVATYPSFRTNRGRDRHFPIQ